MELICLGSSSSGNCYLLRGKAETLIVECGVKFAEVKKALGWTLRAVAGCIVSHEHKDHAKYIAEAMRNGIRVLAPDEAFRGIRSRIFAQSAEPLRGYKLGGFKVYTLPVEHDVPCLGYVIEHAEMGKTLFITDTMMTEYRVKGLNHIMIEANYADDILQANIEAGTVPPSLRDRLMGSHMEIGTTKEFIRRSDLTQVSDIVLLHLSANNSNLTRFRGEVEEISGKPVYVAQRGLKIDFSIMPY